MQGVIFIAVYNIQSLIRRKNLYPLNSCATKRKVPASLRAEMIYSRPHLTLFEQFVESPGKEFKPEHKGYDDHALDKAKPILENALHCR